MTQIKKKEINENELEKLQRQSEEYLNGWRRAKADYENLERRVQKEKAEFIKFANLDLITHLIPIYNNLKLACQHPYKNDEWVKGIEHIKKQFGKVLESNGLEEIIPKEGDKFNPETMEAVQSSQKPVTHNQINKVLDTGYKLHGRVIAPAKVVVK